MTDSETKAAWVERPPFQAHVGIEFIEAKDGTSLLRMDWRPELANRKGDVHGGAVATLLDLAISRAIRSGLSDIAGLSTITMTVNYLEPGRGALIARGKVIRSGRSIAVGEARAEDAQGRIVATASAAFRVIAR
jgi:uncharacterized protein (TIGR00369 family)